MSLNLVWLRRDLRLHDHGAFHATLKYNQPLQAIFVFDTDILARFSDPQDRRLSFLAETLCQLHTQLKQQGGGLLVLAGRASEVVPKLMRALEASALFCAEDYEPATIRRDTAVREALQGQAEMVAVCDHLIHHPAQICKADGDPYRVFTPYSKAWRAALKADSFAARDVRLAGRLAAYDALKAKAIAEGVACLDVEAGAAAMLSAIGYQHAELGEWQVDDMPQRLATFMDQRLTDYKEGRDRVGHEGTSRLSPYLRFGLVSVRECARLAAERPCQGSDTWINELIWREFYAMILYRFPEVVEQEFQAPYRALPWAEDNRLLQAWQEGQTGFPIVDAAMRQLRDTGWMHNRARMIVASFFTKDLHLNWRLGEEHFAQLLMDYELASNNGGWQWAASTGTDAQPYFRIFNPELQSRRFDPEARYIKRYVPELRELEADDIHALHKGDSMFRPPSYPSRVVDHHQAKEKAIAMFKAAAA